MAVWPVRRVMLAWPAILSLEGQLNRLSGGIGGVDDPGYRMAPFLDEGEAAVIVSVEVDGRLFDQEFLEKSGAVFARIFTAAGLQWPAPAWSMSLARSSGESSSPLKTIPPWA